MFIWLASTCDKMSSYSFSWFGPTPILWGCFHPHLILRKLTLRSEVHWPASWAFSSGSGQELPFSPWNITLNLWSRICSNDSLASHTKLSSLRMLNKEVGSHLLEWIEIVSDLWKEGIVYKCRLEMLPSLTVFPLLVLMVCMGKWLTQPHSFTSLFLSIGDNLREQKEL